MKVIKIYKNVSCLVIGFISSQKRPGNFNLAGAFYFFMIKTEKSS